MSHEDIVSLAVSEIFGGNYTGETISAYFKGVLEGGAAVDALWDDYAGRVDAGEMPVENFVLEIIESETVAAVIDLVGLAQSELEYA